MEKSGLVYLTKLKVGEGKSCERVKKEIGDLIQSQYDFKKLKKERRELVKRIYFLESENSRLQKELLKKDLSGKNKRSGIKNTKKEGISTSIVYLSRVLMALKASTKPLSMKQIKDFCNFNRSIHVKKSIGFLVNYKLVEELKGNGTSKYKIKVMEK